MSAARKFTLEFLDREVVANGLMADLLAHALADLDGRWLKKPHVHVILRRQFSEIRQAYRRAGRRVAPQHQVATEDG